MSFLCKEWWSASCWGWQRCTLASWTPSCHSNSSNESTVLFHRLLWAEEITQLNDVAVQQEPCISDVSIFYEPQKQPRCGTTYFTARSTEVLFNVTEETGQFSDYVCFSIKIIGIFSLHHHGECFARWTAPPIICGHRQSDVAPPLNLNAERFAF